MALRPEGHEDVLVPDEPRGRAVAQTFGDFGPRQADGAQPGENGSGSHVRHSSARERDGARQGGERISCHSRICQPDTTPFSTNGSSLTNSSAASLVVKMAIEPSSWGWP